MIQHSTVTTTERHSSYAQGDRQGSHRRYSSSPWIEVYACESNALHLTIGSVFALVIEGAENCFRCAMLHCLAEKMHRSSCNLTGVQIGGVRICCIQTFTDRRCSWIVECPKQVGLRWRWNWVYVWSATVRVYKEDEMTFQLQNTGSAADWPPHRLCYRTAVLFRHLRFITLNLC
jgi:hypothetical protein